MLAEDDVRHGRQQLHRLTGHAEVETDALQDEVQVLVPLVFRVCLAEQILIEVVADGAALAVVVFLRLLMIIVRKDHIQQTCLARRVEVGWHVVGGESDFGAFLEGDGKRLVVLRVDGHVRGDVVVEQAGIQVAVAVVHEQHLGVLRHLVEHVGVVHQFGVAPGEFDGLHQQRQHLEEE